MSSFGSKLLQMFVEGIFVRVYEDRMDLLRAVIVGAYGTPYQDGLFFFDFHLPLEYPDVPPVRKIDNSFIDWIGSFISAATCILLNSVAELLLSLFVFCCFFNIAVCLLSFWRVANKSESV